MSCGWEARWCIRTFVDRATWENAVPFQGGSADCVRRVGANDDNGRNADLWTGNYDFIAIILSRPEKGHSLVFRFSRRRDDRL